MPDYSYRAVSKDEFKEGTISAESERDAKSMLNDQGLTVVSLTPKRPLEIGIFSDFFNRLQKQMSERMSMQEKILFTTQMASMIKAGLPMVEALSTFVDQKSKSGTARITSAIITEIQSGVKFSDALSRFPGVFTPAYIAVVRAGENSGTLAESLNYLGEELKRDNALISKVKSALIYPAVVLTAMVAVMIFISISVVPKIIEFAQSSGQALPTYTLILVRIVTFMTNYWYLVLMLLGLLAAGVSIFAKSKTGSKWIGEMSLKLPIVGNLTARFNQARFSSILGGFYTYGINVITSFDILAASLTNPLYKEACYRIKNRLVYGQSLADAMEMEKGLFPTIMIRLIKGAEKTGDLGNTLNRSSEYYEQELDVTLRNVLSLIEPALVFILGFGVLGLALAVVVPIYKITSTLK